MKKINQLTVKRVQHETKPGRYGDGGGLYLEVSKGGGKSWVFMWKRGGKRRAMGLGSAHVNAISLVEARRLAKEKAEAVNAGRDPIDERRKARLRTITFAEAAVKCHADIGANWRAKRYRQNWLSSLTIHTKPLANRMVSEITADHVEQVMKPLWLIRDWAGDLTRFPDEVIELALAHASGSAVERAYRRGTALEQRRELMDAWAAYCERPLQADNVIEMRREIPATKLERAPGR
jgi:hypothetical protein